jgi:hypothetical protein
VSPSQPENFPYKEDIMAMSNVCLVFIVLLFIGSILTFKVTATELTHTHIIFITYCMSDKTVLTLCER